MQTTLCTSFAVQWARPQRQVHSNWSKRRAMTKVVFQGGKAERKKNRKILSFFFFPTVQALPQRRSRASHSICNKIVGVLRTHTFPLFPYPLPWPEQRASRVRLPIKKKKRCRCISSVFSKPCSHAPSCPPSCLHTRQSLRGSSRSLSKACTEQSLVAQSLPTCSVKRAKTAACPRR